MKLKKQLSNSFIKQPAMRPFLLLWSSQVASGLGSAMTNFALIIWAYQQTGTAFSITLLSFCSYLPSAILVMFAGALTDRWDKKKIMLVCDSIAAMGTLAVVILLGMGSLRIWHLYIVNTVISFMNAFQYPASSVAVSLIAPKDQYTRVGGMQAFSNALVTILTPALATAVLSFAGMKTVLAIDLLSFAAAFFCLLCRIKIPHVRQKTAHGDISFFRDCLTGLKFLKQQKALLHLILFFALVNFLATLSGNGIMPAMILARTGGNQTALGLVSSSIGLGSLAGSVLVTLTRPAKSRSRVIFLSCAASFFLCDVFWGLGRSAWVWVLAAFGGNLPLPFLNANMTTITRTRVPLEMQGRVFSTQSALQYSTIPLGYLAGGFFADYVFEPFMAGGSPLQGMLGMLVGTGKGSGLAVMFLITGVIGCAASLICLKNPLYRQLDNE